MVARWILHVAGAVPGWVWSALFAGLALAAVFSAGRRQERVEHEVQRLREYQRTRRRLDMVPAGGGSSDDVRERLRRAGRVLRDPR